MSNKNNQGSILIATFSIFRNRLLTKTKLPFIGQELLPSNSGQSNFSHCPSLASPAHKGNRLYKGGDPK